MPHSSTGLPFGMPMSAVPAIDSRRQRALMRASSGGSKPEPSCGLKGMRLTEELTSTENKVAFARQAFNDAVMAYNNRREMFPNSIFAGMFGFTAATLLEIPAERKADVRAAPKVQF